MSRAIDRRRLGLVAGLALVLTSLVGLAAPSLAQGAPTEREEPAAVEREAYYTAPSDGAVPATLTNEVPPGIVCILIPQVCGTTTQPVTGPLGEVVAPVTEASLPDYQSPQAVQPDTLPVAMLGGKPRYTSYVKFKLPAIPSGSLVDRFDLVLTETQVSYALESPAFRQAILAGLVSYQTSSPAAFVDFVGSVAEDTDSLAQFAATGIELCAVTAAWPAGTSQDAATQPTRDCIFGANGVHDATAGTWTFDLSLLAQAWLDGDTPNEGVYLGPIGAENLAFGDPDTSTNWQISLGGGASDTPPKLRYAFSEGFGDEEFGDLSGELTLEDDFGGSDLAPSVDTFGGATMDASFDSSSSSFTGATSAPAGTVTTAVTPRPRIRAQLAGESRPQTPWWLWLLLPLGLLMTYAYGRSLDAAPASGHSGRGALSRLMASADGARPAS